MIKNTKEQTMLENLQKKMISYQIKIMSSWFSNSYLSFLLSASLQLICKSSIFSKIPIFTPATINLIFSRIWGSNWNQILQIDQWIIDIIISIMLLIWICFWIVGIFKNDHMIKPTSVFFMLMIIYTTPLVELATGNIQDLFKNSENTPQQLQLLRNFMTIFSTFMIIIGQLLTCYFVFHNAKPVRKDNIEWRYSNIPQFFRHLLNILRCIVFTAGLIGVAPILISLMLQLQIKKLEKPKAERKLGYLNQKVEVINKFCTNIIISFHIVALVAIIAEDLILSTQVSLLLLFCCIIIGSIQFYSLVGCQTLPSCIPQNKIKIYNFYFQLLLKGKKQNNNSLEKVVTKHKLNCSSDDCIFSDYQDKKKTITKTSFLSILTAYFRKYQFQNPESQILYQFWKQEHDMNVSIDSTTRKYKYQYSFIISYLTKTNKENQRDLKSDIKSANFQKQQNNETDSLRQKFYRQIYQIVQNYQTFYLQLDKTNPKLTILTDSLEFIFTNTHKITLKFQQMLREKQLSYSETQLYSKFINSFYNRSKIQMALQEQVEKIKLSNQRNKNDGIGHPCFQVSVQTGDIQNFNMESLKFLRVRKSELKNRKFQTIFEPSIMMEQLYQKCKNNSSTFLFFKKRLGKDKASTQKLIEQQYECANVTIQTKPINNKLYYIVKLKKQQYIKNTFELMINTEQHDLILCNRLGINLQNIFTLRPNQKLEFFEGENSPKMSIEKFYNQKIKNDLILTKQKKTIKIRIPIKNQKQLICYIIQKQNIELKQNTKIFTLRITSKDRNQFRQSRRLKSCLVQMSAQFTPFQFFYEDNFKKDFRLEGKPMSNSKESRQNLTLIRTQKNYTYHNLSMVIPNQTQRILRLSDGIKMYRLYNGQLYNIDFQDKQAYQKQFQEENQMYGNKQKCIKSISLKFVFTVMLIVSVGSLIFSVIFRQTIDQNLEDTATLNTEYGNIKLFHLNFNRLNSILRDTVNGQYEKNEKSLKQDLSQSYQDLLKFSSIRIFSENIKYNFIFSKNKYTGNLNELIQVGLTYIYNFIQDYDTSFIEHIHDYTIKYVRYAIREQSEKKLEYNIQKMNQVLNRSSNMRYIIFGFAIFFSILFLLSWVGFKMRVVKIFKSFFMLSEVEIKRKQEQCQKFKQYISAIIKGYETIFIETSKQKSLTRYRKRSKNIKMGISQFGMEIIFSILISAIYFTISTVCYYEVFVSHQKIVLMIDQQNALVQVYSDICQASNTIQHLGQSDYNYIQNLGNNLLIIQKNKGNFQFSSQLSGKIDILFFGDSCEILKMNNIIKEAENCSMMQPGYIIQNSFELGLDFYLRLQDYNLVYNLKQTFASTGIFSAPFKRIFLKIGQECYTQTSEYIKQVRNKLSILNLILIFTSIFYFSLAFTLYLFFKVKLNRIEDAVDFLNFDNSAQDRTNSKDNKIAQKSNANNWEELLQNFKKTQAKPEKISQSKYNKNSAQEECDQLIKQ